MTTAILAPTTGTHSRCPPLDHRAYAERLTCRILKSLDIDSQFKRIALEYRESKISSAREATTFAAASGLRRQRKPYKECYAPTAGDAGLQGSVRVPSGASAASSDTTGNSRARERSSGKRRAESRDSDGDDDNPRPRKHQERASYMSMQAEGKRFACPFYKRDPMHQFGNKTCTVGWPTVHRVKEHVYRRHAAPIQCPRCWEPFPKDDSLNKHLTAKDACEVKAASAIQVVGMTPKQERKLKARSRLSSQTKEEQWKRMYCILFPDTPESECPSPYAEDVKDANDAIFEHYELIMRRELPKIVKESLTQSFDKVIRDIPKEPSDGILESRLRSLIPDLLSDIVDGAVRSVRSSLPRSSLGTSTEANQQSPAISLPRHVIPSLTDARTASDQLSSSGIQEQQTAPPGEIRTLQGLEADLDGQLLQSLLSPVDKSPWQSLAYTHRSTPPPNDNSLWNADTFALEPDTIVSEEQARLWVEWPFDENGEPM
ncbi:hypothetical protein K491DRAFT_722837 [Lophiostoma macrostomum CBS 122681]|uniref:C2H2-type domain-containing protein n=1 Tax=Lophiostoma macrostomum CBS 122681 TaxID=1314788 RepID=A0A6A6SL15_9PLEO|nr:hypothetical protein K491DRAFT_722837 [Lophiostoma macrostomum CBS 122681]